MKILINGGCGFLGSNVASYLAEKNFDVFVFDNLFRVGASENLKWLSNFKNVRFVYGDIRNKNDVESLIKNEKFDAVYHFSGQVAMTTSIQNPYYDFEVNSLGTMNLLDSIRKYSPDAAVFYSSTNKVYGDLEQYTYTEKEKRYICEEFPNGFDESVPLDFRSPYGCSKGCADQYMLDFSRIFGLKTTVFRHSSMYGSRQFATYDQGWIGWFVSKAVEKKKNPSCEPFSISGNGKQVRDILNALDMAELYYSALMKVDKIYGEAYNIGGTMEQSLSLLELFDLLEKVLDIKLDYFQIAARQSDQKVFVADISKISSKIGWAPKVTAEEGIKKMVEWVEGMNL